MKYIGLGKTLYNSSICVIDDATHPPGCQMALTERLTRKKASGVWPEVALKKLHLDNSDSFISLETRDVELASRIEEIYNTQFPFAEHLEKVGLAQYLSSSPSVKVMSHHLAHAYTALATSPFEQSLIVVLDGAGSYYKDFPQQWHDYPPTDMNAVEACSVYLQQGSSISEVEKFWQVFTPSVRHSKQVFADSVGILYEKAAEYIFGSNQASGKVMGLAPFGEASPIDSCVEYLESLDWNLAFKKESKIGWENSPHKKIYENIAASVQKKFEQVVIDLIKKVHGKYPEFHNLILVGGCALNCTTNRKLLDLKIFDQIFIPPFPGDSGISFGLAFASYQTQSSAEWKPRIGELQHGYWGPIDSIPSKQKIEQIFVKYKIAKPDSIVRFVANHLNEGKIIAWYQGRSESGPRALGNRSILASTQFKDLKAYLNNHIKFRESFRPYGCSCLDIKAAEYFHIQKDFSNLYMSFAIDVKAPYQDTFKEVSHIDGTSRMQIVTKEYNPQFYSLIEHFGDLSGIYCIANTSLNTMGEPIVESLEDLEAFFRESQVDGVAVGEYYITK